VPGHVVAESGWFSTPNDPGAYVRVTFPTPVSLSRVGFSHGHHRSGRWQMEAWAVEVTESVDAPFWRPIYKHRSGYPRPSARELDAGRAQPEVDVRLPDAPAGAPRRYRAVRIVSVPSAARCGETAHRVCLRNLQLQGSVHLAKNLLTQRYVPVDAFALPDGVSAAGPP